MANKWVTQLTKDFAKLADEMPSPSDKVVALPSPSLNWVVGNGGIPYGKIATLFGPESGGKSLLAQLIMVQLQKDNPDGIVIIFDSEYSFNKDWFAKLGGDLSRTIVRQSNVPTTIFDYIGGELLEMLQEGCPIIGMMIDSIASIRYPKDIRKESTKQVQGGTGAAYLGSAFKMVIPVVRQFNITTILVQQCREEMDEYKKMSNPYVVPDGKALKHASDFMLEITRLDTKDGRVEEGKNIYGGAQQVGHKVRVRGKKNRLAAPFRAGEFTLSYTGGIVNIGEEVFELAKSIGVIRHPVNPETGKENVQMWQFGTHAAVRGEENIKKIVVADVNLQNEIMKACYSVDDTVVLARNAALGYVDMELMTDGAFE